MHMSQKGLSRTQGTLMWGSCFHWDRDWEDAPYTAKDLQLPRRLQADAPQSQAPSFRLCLLARPVCSALALGFIPERLFSVMSPALT